MFDDGISVFEDELPPEGLGLSNPNPTPEDIHAYYLAHPVEWVIDIVGATPDPWQVEFLKSVVTRRFVAVRSGHSVGKSTCLAWLICWFLIHHPFCKVICTSPTKEQLFDALWAECFRWIRDSKTLSSLLEWTQDRITMRGHVDWFAVARTAEVRRLGKTGLVAAESLLGRHAHSVLVLVDEASGVDESIMASLDGLLTTPDCYMVMTGNPTRSTGTFFEAFHRNRKLWHTIHVSSEGNTRCEPDFCDRMLKKWGSRDAPMYLIKVRGEFPPDNPESLFSLSQIEESIALPLRAGEFDPVELGVDVARFGDDESVICVRKGPECLGFHTFYHLSTMETCGRVVQAINKYRPVAVKVDVIGVGGGVVDRLHELRYREVVPVNFSSEPRDAKTFLNLRAEAYWNLKMLVERKRFKLPGTFDKTSGSYQTDDDLLSQMTSITAGPNSRGRIQIEAKDKMRARGLKSPDKLDALVLACLPTDVLIPTQARYSISTGNLASFMGR